MIKKILLPLIIILVSLFQVSFIGEFDFLRNNLQLLLVIVIVLTFYSSYKSVLIFSIISGFIVDLFSIYNFGVTTAAFLITFLLINLLFKRLISNKETYSLILVTLIGTVVYNVFLFLVTNSLYIINLNSVRIIFSFDFLYSIIWQLIIHSFLIIIMLVLTKFINKKLVSKFFIS